MELYLEVNSSSLGDTISSTPVVKKISECYDSKVNIVTHVEAIFKKNPYVKNIYSFEEFSKIKLNKKDQVLKTFLGAGTMNEFGVEKKHSIIDIRQFHAIDLGFCLLSSELECEFHPDPYEKINNLPEFFVSMHTSYTWPSRTYDIKKWQKLIDFFQKSGVFVVLLGQNSQEEGWHKVKKDTMKLEISNGLDLTNKTSLSQCWHIINKSRCFITMDSGLLHLAGTTDAQIIQLGSSIKKELRAPYRKGSQDYKYSYIHGSCDLFCASNLKYNVKEWGTIQGIPPIVNCLENKPTFECHPLPEKVFNSAMKLLNNEEFIFKYLTFSYENDQLLLNYSLSDPKYFGDYNIIIKDPFSGVVIYQELLNINNANVNYWTNFTFAKDKLPQNFTVKIDKENKCLVRKNFLYPEFNRSTPLASLSEELYDFDLSGVSLGVLSEVFIDKTYDKGLAFVRKGDVVVDIGFNVGLFSIKAFLGGAKKIYAAEPDKKNIEKFHDINKNERIKNLHISNIAISDKDGFDSLIIDNTYVNSGKSTLQKLAKQKKTDFKYHNNQKIQVKTFKTFIKENEIDRINILKVDCEGGELFVFNEENEGFFKEKVDRVVGEIHFPLSSAEGVGIQNFFKNCGFIFSVDEGPDPEGLVTFSAMKKRKKILFLTPHLSTGGSPSYLLWLINEKKKKGFEVFVLEYCYYGSYEVQREKIIKEIGTSNFIEFLSLKETQEYYDSNHKKLEEIISKISPDYIHLNELSESFGLRLLPDKFLDFLYSVDRKFHVIETSHTSKDNFKNKTRIPDEFYFCSDFHFTISKHIKTKKTLSEMALPKKRSKDKEKARNFLGISNNKFHVLNVGLFTKNKNQKYLYQLAEKLEKYNIEFHFVGNTCFFDDCGLTERQKKLPNCIVHGEKENINDYYEAMDLFVFPSLEELNPISLKEALSWGMDVFLNKLDVYGGAYDENKSVTYINEDNLLSFLMSKNSDIKDTNRFIRSSGDKSKIEVLGGADFDYEVLFLNSITKEVIYETSIKNNMWSMCNETEDIDIKVTNKQTGEERLFEKKKKYINIINESPCLGDCLAWIPVVEKYAEKENAYINLFTPFGFLFDAKHYKNLSFFGYKDRNSLAKKAEVIEMGCFLPDDFRVALQNIACNILKIPIPKKTFKPQLCPSYRKDRPINKKYVCIFTHSTSQLKYWNNKNGWVETVGYLKSIGYEVVCVDKDKKNDVGHFKNSIPANCTDKTGLPLSEALNWIYHSDFVVGLSSGLSWLSWACGKPVVLICGFLGKDYHFNTDFFVQNKEVCNSCWKDLSCSFDRSWDWCGKEKNFECSKKITFGMVKENIDKLIKKYDY